MGPIVAVTVSGVEVTGAQVNVAAAHDVVRSGNVFLHYGGLRFVGASGFYWSSSAYSNNEGAYSLSFNSSSTSPIEYYGRFYGRSLRCLQE